MLKWNGKAIGILGNYEVFITNANEIHFLIYMF